ncbi:MAG TPA: hypothetical protein VJH68_02045 [Candidatus Nanoarchaeia archaeon]|nr:hypothetical protein [Candidatus Nanoarchaeia archaeon]
MKITAKYPLYPYLFLIFIFLFIFNQNKNQLSFSKMIIPLLLSLGLLLALFLILKKLMNSSVKAGLSASLFAGLFFNYGRLYSFVRRPPPIRSLFWIVAAILALISASIILMALFRRLCSSGRISARQPNHPQKFIWLAGTGLFLFFLIWKILPWLYLHIFKPIHYQIIDPPWFLAAISAVFVIMLLWIWRSHYSFNLINEWLQIFSLALLSLISLQLLLGLLGSNQASYSEDTFERLPFDLAAAKQAQLPETAYPDIYYIILDGYAGEKALLDVHNFDNRPFINALQRRGFYVPAESRANYLTTYLSLSSSLNLVYLDFLSGSPGIFSTDQKIPHEMIRQHTVGKNLQQLGYTWVHFSSIWGPTADSRLANITYDPSSLDEFTYLFWWSTPLRFFLPDKERTVFIETMKKIPALAEDNHPVFVFAHLTVPHPPYLFDQDGTELSYSPFEPEQWREKEKYISQLKYLNKRVLLLVDQILENYEMQNSPRKPIIIIQGDHGTESQPGWTKQPTEARADERSLIFNAYYLPPVDLPVDNAFISDIFPAAGNYPDNYPKLYNTISPVNTFRLIFNEYFGQDYPLLPDKTYFSDYTTSSDNLTFTPYNFQEVYRQGKYVGSFS